MTATHFIIFSIYSVLLGKACCTYEESSDYNLGTLQSHTYSLNVELNIKGNIKWENSIDSPDTVIKVTKTAPNDEIADQIVVTVDIDEDNKLIEVMSYYVGSSAGSRPHYQYVLPALLALCAFFVPRGFRSKGTLSITVFLMLYITCMCTHSDDDAADITIQTPTHTVILAGNLTTHNGEIHVLPTKVKSTTDLICSSGASPNGQCNACCNGNGICSNGHCQCFDGFINETCIDSVTYECEEIRGDPGTREHIKVLLTVENTLTDDAQEFKYCTTIDAISGQSAFNMINRTAKQSPSFSIESKSFAGLGEYVSAINGLSENSTLEYYWGFARRYPLEGDCLYPVGSSCYRPVNLEHIVFFLLRYDQFNQYPTCRTHNLNFTKNMDDPCYNL